MVVFNEDDHSYYLGDKYLTSVTQYISKFKTPFIYVVVSTEPEKDAKSIVPLSFIKEVVVIAVKPSPTVDPEKKPLSSASLETIPFINLYYFVDLKGT